MARVEHRYSLKSRARTALTTTKILHALFRYIQSRRSETDFHFLQDEGWAASCHASAAMAKWPDTGEPDQTGFGLAHGKATYDYLSEHPESLYV